MADSRGEGKPEKYYLQHYKKGVKFLGTVIKGERIYIANRTLGKAMCRLHGFNRQAEEAARHGAKPTRSIS